MSKQTKARKWAIQTLRHNAGYNVTEKPYGIVHNGIMVSFLPSLDLLTGPELNKLLRGGTLIPGVTVFDDPAKPEAMMITALSWQVNVKHRSRHVLAKIYRMNESEIARLLKLGRENGGSNE